MTDRVEVSQGESATLTWSWPSASQAYLSTAGLVANAGSGSMEVRPKETTDYVLVIETSSHETRILSQRVVVKGAKGSSTEWPRNPFLPLAYEREYRVAKISLVRLADRVRTLLSSFEVQQFSQERETLVFVTGFSEKAELKRAGEPRRRAIQYRVALSSFGSEPIQVKVSATIRWRGLIDNRWFPETSNELYEKIVGTLGGQIAGSQP
jgi:hypothetical protein